MNEEPDFQSAIVVGHDGSPRATGALQTAIGYAEALGAPLLIVRAWPLDRAYRNDTGSPSQAASVRASLMDACRPVLDGHPRIDVEYRAESGAAGDVLVRLSESARMLVLGSRGLGELGGILLGSVTTRCLHHASCPVLVVRAAEGSAAPEPAQGYEPVRPPQLLPGSIVVGHDGSPGSDRAMREAAALAAASDARLAVVRCWTIDTMPPGLLWRDGYVLPFNQASDAIQRYLEADISAIVMQYPDLEIRCYGVFDDPRELLVRLASDAVLLVVGSRGRGGFRTLLLGSVSAYCAQRAVCPTLVVPVHSDSAG